MFNMNVITSWQRNTSTKEDRIFVGILSGLMLLIGLFVGYWVSETKKASPIIFEGGNVSPQVLSDSDIAKLTTAVQLTENPQKTTSPQITTTSSNTSDNFVAALSGTKYYFANCSEVKRIKEENRIFFNSEQEAIDAGYEASSCVLKSR